MLAHIPGLGRAIDSTSKCTISLNSLNSNKPKALINHWSTAVE